MNFDFNHQHNKITFVIYENRANLKHIFQTDGLMHIFICKMMSQYYVIIC